jgi:hypothetical protein
VPACRRLGLGIIILSLGDTRTEFNNEDVNYNSTHFLLCHPFFPYAFILFPSYLLHQRSLPVTREPCFYNIEADSLEYEKWLTMYPSISFPNSHYHAVSLKYKQTLSKQALQPSNPTRFHKQVCDLKYEARRANKSMISLYFLEIGRFITVSRNRQPRCTKP